MLLLPLCIFVCASVHVCAMCAMYVSGIRWLVVLPLLCIGGGRCRLSQSLHSVLTHDASTRPSQLQTMAAATECKYLHVIDGQLRVSAPL